MQLHDPRRWRRRHRRGKHSRTRARHDQQLLTRLQHWYRLRLRAVPYNKRGALRRQLAATAGAAAALLSSSTTSTTTSSRARPRLCEAARRPACTRRRRRRPRRPRACRLHLEGGHRLPRRRELPSSSATTHLRGGPVHLACGTQLRRSVAASSSSTSTTTSSGTSACHHVGGACARLRVIR